MLKQDILDILNKMLKSSYYNQFIIKKAIKSVNEAEIIRLEDLLNLKYIKTKLYNKIVRKYNKEHNVNESIIADLSTISLENDYKPIIGTEPYKIIQILKNKDGITRELINYRMEFKSISFKILLKKKAIVLDEKRLYLANDFSYIEPMEITPKPFNLIIDSREHINVQNYFQKHNISYILKNLTVGDFVWINNETFYDFIVERKVNSDLTSSLFDGRYKEQYRRMSLLFNNIFYLLENCSERNITNYLRHRAIVLESKNVNQTLSIIKNINDYIPKLKPSINFDDFYLNKKSKITCKDFVTRIIYCIRGINYENSIEIGNTVGTFSNLSAYKGKYSKKISNMGLL